ncbi:Tyrosine-protein phosphatase Lar [Lucilia cuprina]|nr:Tyrosine-protein phosphatase Lar [Lucilia cuprina]
MVNNFIKFYFYFCFFHIDPPEIIKKPQNQGVRVGGVATFYCAARGDPPPSIVWRKNGKKVSGKLKLKTVEYFL